MSFRSKVIVLGSLFVVLLAVLVVGMAVSPRGAAARAAASPLVPRLRAGDVIRVELADSTSRVALLRGDQWSLEVTGGQFPANRQRVDALVREVAAASRGTLISRGTNDDASLGFDEKTVRHLVLRGASGAVLCELSIGKQGAGGGVYLRVGQSPEIWLTGEGLVPYLTTDGSFWADLRVLPADVTGSAVMRISVSSGRSFTWTATRQKDAQNRETWYLAGRPGVKAPAEKLDSLANAVADLTGSGFIPGPVDRKQFQAPTGVVVVSLTDNRTFSVLFAARTPDGKYPCIVEQGEHVYLVPEWKVKEIVVPESILTSAPS